MLLLQLAVNGVRLWQVFVKSSICIQNLKFWEALLYEMFHKYHRLSHKWVIFHGMQSVLLPCCQHPARLVQRIVGLPCRRGTQRAREDVEMMWFKAGRVGLEVKFWRWAFFFGERFRWFLGVWFLTFVGRVLWGPFMESWGIKPVLMCFFWVSEATQTSWWLLVFQLGYDEVLIRTSPP